MENESALLKAIAVTAQVMGTELTPEAAKMFVYDLTRYPQHQVMRALERCRREVKGRLTIADVISRIDDGRPGVEEAWAMLPKDESTSIVWTDEMAYASGVAGPLMGDSVAARMAFKEAYQTSVQRARDDGVPVKWWLSQGWDKSGRAAAIREAEARGRISVDRAQKMIAHSCPEAAYESTEMLSGPSQISALLEKFKGGKDAA